MQLSSDWYLEVSFFKVGVWPPYVQYPPEQPDSAAAVPGAAQQLRRAQDQPLHPQQISLQEITR